MRIIETYILRLLMDTDEPTSLRGTLHPVGEDTTHTFTNGQELLAILMRRTKHRRDTEGTEKHQEGQKNP